MRDKVLKLCRRLRHCTLDDLTTFLESDAAIIETVLLYLEQEEIININDGVITVNSEPAPQKNTYRKRLEIAKEFISDEKFDFIVKAFCLEISPMKVAPLININQKRVCRFECAFRKAIYDLQFKELLQQFFNKPQIGRYRMFYNKYAFFYVYNNNIYISEKLLRASEEKNFTKPEIQEFKKMYSYLARVESHNINENYMYYRLAEYIWRRNKNFETLYSEIKSLI